jgi:hypothetical protein
MCSTPPEIGHWEDSLIAIVVPVLPVGTLCQVGVTTPFGSSNTIDFTVIQTSTISGSVKTNSGKGIKKVQVLVTAGASGIVTTNNQGSDRKSGLASGQYTVKPVLSGYLFTPEFQAVTVHTASVSNINFIGASVLPMISKLNPQQGTANTHVTISGSGFGSFDASINTVSFGGADILLPIKPKSPGTAYTVADNQGGQPCNDGNGMPRPKRCSSLRA